MDSSLLLGMAIGSIFGTVVIGAVTAGITYLIGRGLGKNWHGWWAAVWMGALAVLGQLVQMKILGVCGGLVGILILIGQARKSDALRAQA